MNQPSGILTKSFSFNIDVFDACMTTVLSLSPSVNNMVAYVDQGTVTQTITTTDTAGQTYANAFFCGTRILAISPTTYTFLTLASGVLTLQSTDPL